MESEDDGRDKLIIHDKCGLPVELCECSDAEVVYDPELDCFVDRGEDDS